MKRIELAVEGLRSIAWAGDDLVDWIGGRRVRLDGEVVRFGVGESYRFDGSAGLGDIGAAFETLGTKGRLMRWNAQVAQQNFVPLGFDEFREIDRSYYCANVYDYPLCLFRLPDGRAAIAHCPKRYDTLEMELLDGTPLTTRNAKAVDIFHARLAVSRDGRWLLDNGWVWHPVTIVAVYDVARALREPDHLSSSGISIDLGGASDGDVDAATFSGDRLVACSGGKNPRLYVDLPSGRLLFTGPVSNRSAPGSWRGTTIMSSLWTISPGSSRSLTAESFTVGTTAGPSPGFVDPWPARFRCRPLWRSIPHGPASRSPTIIGWSSFPPEYIEIVSCSRLQRGVCHGDLVFQRDFAVAEAMARQTRRRRRRKSQ